MAFSNRGIAGSTGLLAALAVASTTASAAAHADTPTWRVVRTLKNATYSGVTDVAAVGPKNVWAFTGVTIAGREPGRPAALHWNGGSWRSTKLPKGLKGSLVGGDHSSPANVWAIGRVFGGGSYVLRWNGAKWAVTKQWKRGRVTGITVINPKDVWVFGAPEFHKGVGTWHYDGTSWTKAAVPFHPDHASKVSGSDIWAVGSGLKGDQRTIGRWDGRRWSIVPTGDLLPADSPPGDHGPSRQVYVNDVFARSATDVWATVMVSSYAGGEGPEERPILIHWDGRSWKRLTAPKGASIDRIASDGGAGLWFTGTRPWEGGLRGVIQHRTANGRWTAAKVAGAGTLLPHIYDLAPLPGTRRLIGGGILDAEDQSSTDGAIFRFGG